MREEERIETMKQLLRRVRSLSDYITGMDELSLFSADVTAEVVASVLRLERLVERSYAKLIGVDVKEVVLDALR